MKAINWGKGIMIAFGLFATFILYFVYRVQSDPKYDNELVVEEYYKKDMRYGEEMERMQNAAALTEQPEIAVTGEGIQVRFPAGDLPEAGTVSFYRPSSGNLDFSCPLSSTDPLTAVPASKLVAGRWGVTLEWTRGGRHYLIKQQLYF